ncbi:ATP-binding protein [Thiomicrospira microaerophila]|uniref:ATP-binding protein n=1 Tax=Thiomicrospira microaerophila TaxID=406020 RepID=UPI0005C9AAE1|nr:ATP-binding protein [Thiomicrospira microaerophila]
MSTKIFPTSLVIDSMKSSGYKDAAHAVAEVVDNSIQAAYGLNRDIDIKIIAIENQDNSALNTGGTITEIGIYDNASGMSSDILGQALAFGVGTRKGAKSGMGKFGMGLPNASISQADRVEVYSWQNGEIYFSYLDIDEIIATEAETLKNPIRVDQLPKKWIEILETTEDSGTLVIWSKLTRLKWKRHKAFFRNTAVLLGRMYRYYLTKDKSASYIYQSNHKLNITVQAFTQNGNAISSEEIVKPYDPAYTLEDADWPEKHSGAKFHEFFKEVIDITLDGETHKVVIRTAIVEQAWFHTAGDAPGSSPFGKEVNKHLGVSVVREGRELELNKTFVKSGDPKERFWSIEVHFPAALDELFGVTNNKQSATAFNLITMEELLAEEGLENEFELERNQDLRYILVKNVIKKVNSMIVNARHALPNVMRSKNKLTGEPKQDRVDAAYSKATNHKPEPIDNPIEVKESMTRSLESLGLDSTSLETQKIVKDWLETQSIAFGVSPIAIGNSFFSTQIKCGKVLVLFNRDHEAFEHFIKPFEEISSTLESDDQSFNAFKLIIAAFAKVELEAEDEKEKRLIRRIREDWGRMAEDMILALTE